MGKMVMDLDEFKLKTCISKLRDLNREKLILNRQLDELIVEYMGLENINIEIE